MKRSFITVFLILVSLLAAENPNVQDKMNEHRRPLYEKIPLIRDYRVNQPIKNAIKWGSIGMFASYLGAKKVYPQNDYYHDWSEDTALEIGWETCKITMIAGGLYGLYKGFKAQNHKKKNPTYVINKNKIGYESCLLIDPFVAADACTNKINQSLTITYDYKYLFIDEILLSIIWSWWPDLEETKHVYDERKYDIRINHYYLKGYLFSPYYGLGGGLSYGKRRHDEWYFDDTKVVSSGLYPFIHTSVGIRFSVLDFFYLKIEADFELSSFYFYASSYEDYSFLTNLTFGLVVGTKIF